MEPAGRVPGRRADAMVTGYGVAPAGLAPVRGG